MNGKFASEAEMVDRFVDLLDSECSPWGGLQTTTEWDYRTGIVDVLARTEDGHLIAFEAKLSDWRRAAHQAYRSTVYACLAYVLLPSNVAERARTYEDVFARYGVGLCAFDENGVSILIEARKKEPLLPWLYERAQSFFNTTAHEPPVQKSQRDSYPLLRGA